MAAIQSIQLTIETADVEGAGFDGVVVLGFGGVEFTVKKFGEGAFQRGHSHEFGFGGSNSNYVAEIGITEADIRNFPVYIRSIVSDINFGRWWALKSVKIRVNGEPRIRCSRTFDGEYWMGNTVVHLRKHLDPLGPDGFDVESPITG